ncbi:hypothetical protein PRCB_17550 [Pantoea rodasii]|uniref:Uncharacterized protein n=1 Tax=Pantoea rodasii TaxID=1076549 RepID=A0A2M9W981_9GAMM|nr:hypothetical protein HA45_12690 [Pantoea rodasii]PJZ04085.1 hypothetical protein PRCB_17550 [Pantoea rodasii]
MHPADASQLVGTAKLVMRNRRDVTKLYRDLSVNQNTNELADGARDAALCASAVNPALGLWVKWSILSGPLLEKKMP